MLLSQIKQYLKIFFSQVINHKLHSVSILIKKNYIKITKGFFFSILKFDFCNIKYIIAHKFFAEYVGALDGVEYDRIG